MLYIWSLIHFVISFCSLDFIFLLFRLFFFLLNSHFFEYLYIFQMDDTILAWKYHCILLIEGAKLQKNKWERNKRTLVCWFSVYFATLKFYTRHNKHPNNQIIMNINKYITLIEVYFFQITHNQMKNVLFYQQPPIYTLYIYNQRSWLLPSSIVIIYICIECICVKIIPNSICVRVFFFVLNFYFVFPQEQFQTEFQYDTLNYFFTILFIYRIGWNLKMTSCHWLATQN